MIRARIATAALALALTGCASTAQNRDVAAVVQDERGRQAVAQAIDEGKTADEALSKASEASELTREPPR
jgi:hypothetical protein